jgi:hypothetical protein
MPKPDQWPKSQALCKLIYQGFSWSQKAHCNLADIGVPASEILVSGHAGHGRMDGPFGAMPLNSRVPSF